MIHIQQREGQEFLEETHKASIARAGQHHRKFGKKCLRKIVRVNIMNLNVEHGVNLHLNLSTSLPEHIIASATFMEKTRILPELSLEYALISQFNKSPAFESTGT